MEDELARDHLIGTSHITCRTFKNFKGVLNKLEHAGKITGSEPHTPRPTDRDEKAFADGILLTFPPRRMMT